MMDPIRWQPDRPPRTTLAGAVVGDGLGRGWPVAVRSAARDGCSIDSCASSSQCEQCAAPLGLARADDAPPYFTILIVGHIVIPAMLIMQKMSDPPTWLLAVIFLPLTVILAIGLLRPVKGAHGPDVASTC